MSDRHVNHASKNEAMFDWYIPTLHVRVCADFVLYNPSVKLLGSTVSSFLAFCNIL